MNTKNRKNFYVGISVLLCAILVAMSSLYAWLAIGDFTDNVQFTLFKINSMVTLYKSVDDNLNGIPNRLNEKNTEQSNYYDEYYEFEKIAEATAFSEKQTDDVSLKIQIQKAYPSQVFTYKLSLKNMSELENVIVLTLEEKELLTDDEKRLLATLSLRVGQVDEQGKIQFATAAEGTGDKLYFGDSYNGTQRQTFFEGEIAGETDGMEGSYLDFWLCFEMEPYDSLPASVREGLTKTEYNALQNKSVTFPFCVYFEVRSDAIGNGTETAA